MENKMNKKLLGIMSIMAVVMMSGNVEAANVTTLGGMALEAEKNIASIKQLAMSVFYMIGLFLFGMGLFLLYKDQKTPNQGHAKNGFISIIIGVCMLLIPQLIGIIGGSMGVDGATATGNIQVPTGF